MYRHVHTNIKSLNHIKDKYTSVEPCKRELFTSVKLKSSLQLKLHKSRTDVETVGKTQVTPFFYRIR